MTDPLSAPPPVPPRKGEKIPVPRGRYKARGVVLHSMKYGERKRIIHIFTREYGRQSYITTLTNHGKGLFQPLFILDFDGWQGRGELHNIEQPAAAIPLREIPFDIVKSTIALFLSELLYRLIKDGEADPGLYEFVEGAITSLDGMTDGTANFHLWFLVRLTYYMGYEPEDNYLEGYALDYRNGTYVRPDLPSHTLIMPPADARLFHELMEADTEDLVCFKMAREQRVSLLERLIDLYGFHTEAIYGVNSLRILSEIF